MFRWSTKPRVVVADSGREFAFVTTYLGSDMTKWTYRFEPAPNGARVTESFEMMRDMPWVFRVTDRLMGVKDRKADLEAGMGETLRRFKAVGRAGHGIRLGASGRRRARQAAQRVRQDAAREEHRRARTACRCGRASRTACRRRAR